MQASAYVYLRVSVHRDFCVFKYCLYQEVHSYTSRQNLKKKPWAWAWIFFSPIHGHELGIPVGEPLPELIEVGGFLVDEEVSVPVAPFVAVGAFLGRLFVAENSLVER